MYFFLKILIFLIVIVGHVFGYRLFYKENSIYKENVFVNLFQFIYPSFIIIILFCYILSGRYFAPRTIFLIGGGLIFIMSCILSALAANILTQKMEERLSSDKSRILYFSRLSIIAFGAFCMTSAFSISKSTLYLLNVSKYDFGVKIEKIIDQKSAKKIEEKNLEINKMNFFLADIISLKQDTLDIEKKSILSPFSGNYKVNIGSNKKFSLAYRYSRGNSDAPSDVHTISYTSNVKGNDCFVVSYTGMGNRFQFIESKKLIQMIMDQNNEFKLITDKIEKNPASIIDFTISSLMDILGAKGYEFSASNPRSENIELILRYFFIFLSTIVFFEFSRKWKH